jgi:hypothetical protein
MERKREDRRHLQVRRIKERKNFGHGNGTCQKNDIQLASSQQVFVENWPQRGTNGIFPSL